MEPSIRRTVTLEYWRRHDTEKATITYGIGDDDNILYIKKADHWRPVLSCHDMTSEGIVARLEQYYDTYRFRFISYADWRSAPTEPSHVRNRFDALEFW